MSSRFRIPDLSPKLKADLQVIASRSNGSLGDFRVAQKILRFDPLSTRLHLQFARDYRPSALKNDNVILIGSSRSNPWVSLFEGQAELHHRLRSRFE